MDRKPVSIPHQGSFSGHLDLRLATFTIFHELKSQKDKKEKAPNEPKQSWSPTEPGLKICNPILCATCQHSIGHFFFFKDIFYFIKT